MWRRSQKWTQKELKKLPTLITEETEQKREDKKEPENVNVKR